MRSDTSWGDRVLKDIGALFLRRTRSDDVIARYGGDEFVLLVLNLTAAEVRAVAERLAAELSQLQWNVADSTLHIALTIGIACSSLMPGSSLDQLLEAADRDLYAKKAVKNASLSPAGGGSSSSRRCQKRWCAAAIMERMVTACSRGESWRNHSSQSTAARPNAAPDQRGVAHDADDAHVLAVRQYQ